MKIKQLWSLVGGLSSPSKMPKHGWGISAAKCKRGSALRKIPGSVCSECFACKGRYLFENVQNAHDTRLNAYCEDPEAWRDNMIELLNKKDTKGYFRWFDSGDVQSVQMLEHIGQIAAATPGIMHWLPTKEISIVNRLRRTGWKCPNNLVIRLSADMIGQVRNHELPTSSVSAEHGHLCPASRGDVSCEQAGCYACWDRTVKNVDYALH